MTGGDVLRFAINRLRGGLGAVYKAVRGETDRSYMALLRASQGWPRQALEAYQWRRLQALVAHAWQTVPFYRSAFEAAGLSPWQIRTSRDLHLLPVLTRSDLCDGAERMISCRFAPDRLDRRFSGGSTGEPVRVYLDARRRRLAVTEEIWADGFSGWRVGEPVAQIWAADGAAPVGALRRWARRHVLSPGFITDARELDRRSFVEFVDNYRAWRPGLVVAYASALRPLAEFLLDEKVSLHPPRAVISSAEILDEHTRAMAQRAFAAPVVDRYGCREAALVAFQCSRLGRYHVNMLRIFLELVDEQGRAVPAGQPGRILLTDLGNFAMPLIRYEVGDMAVWADEGGCACGSGFQCLERIIGRTSDFVCSPQGRLIHRARFNSLLLGVPGLRQYRIVQESLNDVRLEIVESRPIDPAVLRQVCAALRDVLGRDVELRLDRRTHLPQTASGKYRYVASRVPVWPAVEKPG